ncbi:ubiquitin binding protein [Dacryopinax primogenitus]|uniref:Vacuolar protein sorting-associated protein 27 n=1 Tax=Dacryopinax primogenitus (strain DJM 731) TaxID=1858805 RepID=M5G5I0_DACPD|nr:ubiquitin binding protein [Dacryopinax primogenitus]EJT99012.1 ubiquitin binding protein [Dacryopinax primogenitus]
MASLFWGASPFDDLVDKATSELLPAGGSDIALNLEICDQIRSKSTTLILAMRAIKRRIDHKNPNVQLLALELADTCTKNGGDTFLQQVASREFMDDLASIVKSPGVNRDVKLKILRLVQTWARGMEGNSELKYVGETYKTLKSSGFEFPPESPREAAATLFQTATAPMWGDSDRCMRCREPFTMTFRKHHCRNCGQTFCQSCSSYTSRLDHFGINTEVRVCKDCHDKMTRKTVEAAKRELKKDGIGSRNWVKRERERADKDLERAIALSLAEAKNMGHVDDGAMFRPAVLSKGYPPPTTIAEEDDPDLAAAIKASLEEYQTMNVPSAPSPMPERPGTVESYFPQPPPALPNYDLMDSETLTILDFSEAIENGASARSVDGLHNRADRLRPRLVRSLDDTERKEQILTDMHGKLAEVVKLFDSHLNAQLERRASSYHQPQRTQTYASFAPQRTVSPQASYGPPQQQQYAPPQQQPYAPQQTYAVPQQQAYAPPPLTYQEPVQPPQQSYVQQPPQQMYTSPPKQQQPISTVQAYPSSPVRSNTGIISPPPMQASTSPVMQMSVPQSALVSAQAQPVPAAPPAVTYQAPVSQPHPYMNPPAPPSRQQSYVAPAAPAQPAYVTSPAPSPTQQLPPQLMQAQPPPQQYALAQAPPIQVQPVQPPPQQLPAFPQAPQNVFPSAFPEAPKELPNSFAYAPVREEKEVALIEL